MPLETESTLRIRSIIKDFKPNNGDLLGALHAVQHELGYPVSYTHLTLPTKLEV